MTLSNVEQIGLILAGTVAISVVAAVVAYYYDTGKPPAKPRKKLDPVARSLEQWSKQLGIEFDPNDPNDPVAALIAAGDYFRAPGCEPGGPHYEETFRRVVLMIEDMVPPDRLGFWIDQVYQIYGSSSLPRKKN